MFFKINTVIPKLDIFAANVMAFCRREGKTTHQNTVGYLSHVPRAVLLRGCVVNFTQALYAQHRMWWSGGFLFGITERKSSRRH
jgi:hypothetical protein